MQDHIRKVIEFHRAFKIPLRESYGEELKSGEYELRHRLMAEENDEYLEACRTGDTVAIADALGDMMYVLLGTVVTHGLQDKLAAVVEEIHQSNMSKLDEDGNPILREDGKVLKSDRFFRPDLRKILYPEFVSEVPD